MGVTTRAAEEELARLSRLACAPFRPARQSKLFLVGLGLGHTLASVCAELKQKRGSFIVAEPLAAIPEWHRAHLPESPLLTDDRVVLENDCSPPALTRTHPHSPALTRHAGMLHAILLHLDASPTGLRNRPWVDDRRWLNAAFEALQAGGLLAITGSRYAPILTRNLQRSGFEVAEFTVPAALGAKKPRFIPIWRARKGRAADG
jgi:hypothetical protein